MAHESQWRASVPIPVQRHHTGIWKSAMKHLHQRHWQMIQIGALLHTREPVVKHLPAHHCIHLQGPGHDTPLLSHRRLLPLHYLGLDDPKPSWRSRDALRLPADQGTKCPPGLRACLCSGAGEAFSPCRLHLLTSSYSRSGS